MSRGLGATQRAVLAVANANRVGLTADTIARQIHGRNPTAAQLESVRRAIRTLRARGMLEVTIRRDSRPRKSLKRFVDLAPCEAGLCAACARRKRRVRFQDRHRRVMRANAKHDPAWLGDLAIAEKSGFVHETASTERVVDEKPNTVDQCQRRLQFISPLDADH